MPYNISGTLAALQSFVYPRVILPRMMVQDIRCLNFKEFRQHGYRGVVIDKDNCLTLPHDDSVIPELQAAWGELKLQFPPPNVLIVSNSAGSSQDAAGLAAESITHSLGAPVLRHAGMKPSYDIVNQIRHYFACLPQPILEPKSILVIGDRIFTDIVLADRLGAFSILVTRDWTRSLKGWLVSTAEQSAVRIARNRLSHPEESFPQLLKATTNVGSSEVRLNYTGSTWTWTGRALGWSRNTGKGSSN